MTARRQDSPDPGLCHYKSSDGRQCSMPATLGLYCRSHAAPHFRRSSAEADLSSELAPFFRGPDSNLDVHRALECVFKALSANRITNRRAATFGYLGQLILLSKPGEESASLSKRDLHDLANVTCTLLETAYGPNSRRSAPPAQTPQDGAPSSANHRNGSR